VEEIDDGDVSLHLVGVPHHYPKVSSLLQTILGLCFRGGSMLAELKE
jgi:hypothetical protein